MVITTEIKPEAMDMKRFVKMLGYSRASQREFKDVLRILVSRGFVKIQQNGFLADSMHHHKLAVIVKPIHLDYFKKKLLRTNYRIGNFTVHITTKKRKCDSCHITIRPNERYCSKIKLAKYGRVRAMEILCLACLLTKYSEEDIW